MADFSNGIISYLDRLLPELEAQKIETRLVSGDLGSSYIGDAYPLWKSARTIDLLVGAGLRLTHRIAPSWASDFSFRSQLYFAGRHFRRREPIDLVEMEETMGVAPCLAAGAGAPLVLRLHGPAFLNRAANGYAKGHEYEAIVRREGRAIARAAAISAPAYDVLDKVRNYYDLPLEEAVVIPNAGPFPRKEEEWKLAESEPQRILFIGRFDRHKGADVVIDAFSDLLRTHPDARLTIVGPDLGFEDDFGRPWNAEGYIADRLGANRQKVTVLGRVENHKLPALRCRAAVVVHPSRYEVFGVAALEACAQGAPLIASDVGGLAEIVTHNKTGLLVPPGNALALANCFRYLFDNPDLAASLGESALTTYCERFTPDIVARQTSLFYGEVLNRLKRHDNYRRL